eukprot:scaffold479462_cov145-Attheya_sp.AAC.1
MARVFVGGAPESGNLSATSARGWATGEETKEEILPLGDVVPLGVSPVVPLEVFPVVPNEERIIAFMAWMNPFTAVLDTNTSVLEINTPALETNTPALETNTPALETNTPALETNTSALGTNTPALETNTPAPYHDFSLTPRGGRLFDDNLFGPVEADQSVPAESKNSSCFRSFCRLFWKGLCTYKWYQKH